MADSDTGDATIFGHVTARSGEEGTSARVRDRHDLAIDEPDWVPIGDDTAPCPVDYLCVAAAGCQVEVLKQGLEKARVEEYEIRVDFERHTVDPDDAPDAMPGHLSILVEGIDLELTVETTAEYEDRARRVVDVCDDVCIVSRSIQSGVDVTLEKDVRVAD